MSGNPLAKTTPFFQVLSQDQKERINLAVLQVLETTGRKVTEPEARELLHGGGARIDGDRVRIPAWMVEDAVRTAPRRVTLYTRDRTPIVLLEPGRGASGALLDSSCFIH